MFSKCYETTGWGQVMDSIYSRQKNLKQDSITSLTISTYKTAYYTIFYPMAMGYALAGKNDKQKINKIRDFAMPLGQAFQIRDDILGVFGDSQKTGKSDTSDIVEGKFTLLVNMVLKNLKGREKQEFICLFSKEKKSGNDINNIKKIIKTSLVLDKAKLEMDDLYGKALNNLKKLNIKAESQDVLEGLIDKLKELY